MQHNLTKKEIVLQLSKTLHVEQKLSKLALRTVLDLIRESLAHGRNVELRNFGVFEIKMRKRRIGRNPNNPRVEIAIPERAIVKFKSGKALREALDKLSYKSLQKN